MILRPRSLLGRIIIVILVLYAVTSIIKKNKILHNSLIADKMVITGILYKETATLMRFVNKKDTVSKTIMVAKRLRNKINVVLFRYEYCQYSQNN